MSSQAKQPAAIAPVSQGEQSGGSIGSHVVSAFTAVAPFDRCNRQFINDL